MRRVFYPHTMREEFADGAGMWRIVATVAERQPHIDRASALMADPMRFADGMRRALTEWPRSCEATFTTEGNNQRAWLGHAGCFLAVGSPEECTRLAWHTLDAAEQWAANDAADRVIAEWRAAYEPLTSSDQLSIFGWANA